MSEFMPWSEAQLQAYRELSLLLRHAEERTGQRPTTLCIPDERRQAFLREVVEALGLRMVSSTELVDGIFLMQEP